MRHNELHVSFGFTRSLVFIGNISKKRSNNQLITKHKNNEHICVKYM